MARNDVVCSLEPEAPTVSLGIRPEDLRLVAGAVEPGSPGAIPAEVEVVEPLGYDTYVTCRTGERLQCGPFPL
ncbi:MAG: TOBE domain-containing protein [Candidatus Latescibacteria bacterium]|nr:TOBE domain-containing protein [Candidatus Latescibacterota bacterium]